MATTAADREPRARLHDARPPQREQLAAAAGDGEHEHEPQRIDDQPARERRVAVHLVVPRVARRVAGAREPARVVDRGDGEDEQRPGGEAAALLHARILLRRVGERRRLEANAGRARAVGVRLRVADVNDVACGDVQKSERVLEDRGRRLRRPRLRRRDDGVDERRAARRRADGRAARRPSWRRRRASARRPRARGTRRPRRAPARRRARRRTRARTRPGRGRRRPPTGTPPRNRGAAARASPRRALRATARRRRRPRPRTRAAPPLRPARLRATGEGRLQPRHGVAQAHEGAVRVDGHRLDVHGRRSYG